jgi:hypothetical protein
MFIHIGTYCRSDFDMESQRWYKLLLSIYYYNGQLYENKNEFFNNILEIRQQKSSWWNIYILYKCMLSQLSKDWQEIPRPL